MSLYHTRTFGFSKWLKPNTTHSKRIYFTCFVVWDSQQCYSKSQVMGWGLETLHYLETAQCDGKCCNIKWKETLGCPPPWCRIPSRREREESEMTTKLPSLWNCCPCIDDKSKKSCQEAPQMHGSPLLSLRHGCSTEDCWEFHVKRWLDGTLFPHL